MDRLRAAWEGAAAHHQLWLHDTKKDFARERSGRIIVMNAETALFEAGDEFFHAARAEQVAG
jgi:hypothetical protein